MNPRQDRVRHFDAIAAERDHWRNKNRYYYQEQQKLLKFLVPARRSVLDLGCGTGETLAELNPSRGTGVDFSEEMLKLARERASDSTGSSIEYVRDDAESLKLTQQYDYVLLIDLIGELTDVWKAFRGLRKNCHGDSVIVVTYFNSLWEPVLKLGEKLGLKMPQQHQNWLSLADIRNLLELNGYEVIKQGQHLLFPKYIPGISTFINRYIANLPIVNLLCLNVYIVARPIREPEPPAAEPSVSVVIPCRNEYGNIRDALDRVPNLGSHTEIMFVDGNSNDGTAELIEELAIEYKGKDIKLVHQVPPGSEDGRSHGKMLALGKGDAVRKGFAAASGEILMILDADLTVPPEELDMFYYALVENRGKCVLGTRLIYPMEKQAMRFLNKIANTLFGMLFSWILGQRIKDTLCGTKALYKSDYEVIAANRGYFGGLDPFGDFDLIFGAAKQNLKLAEVPIHYKDRTYGDVKIERFKHGLLLIKMSFIAMRKFKFR